MSIYECIQYMKMYECMLNICESMRTIPKSPKILDVHPKWTIGGFHPRIWKSPREVHWGRPCGTALWGPRQLFLFSPATSGPKNFKGEAKTCTEIWWNVLKYVEIWWHHSHIYTNIYIYIHIHVRVNIIYILVYMYICVWWHMMWCHGVSFAYARHAADFSPKKDSWTISPEEWQILTGKVFNFCVWNQVFGKYIPTYIYIYTLYIYIYVYIHTDFGILGFEFLLQLMFIRKKWCAACNWCESIDYHQYILSTWFDCHKLFNWCYNVVRLYVGFHYHQLLPSLRSRHLPVIRRFPKMQVRLAGLFNGTSSPPKKWMSRGHPDFRLEASFEFDHHQLSRKKMH